MSEYPIKERIKGQLDKRGLKLIWLLSELGYSQRWYSGLKSISELSVKTLEDISQLIGMNLLIDYLIWRGELTKEGSIMQEPNADYAAAEPPISVNLSIQGSPTSISRNFAKVLAMLQSEGKKAGLKIE